MTDIDTTTVEIDAEIEARAVGRGKDKRADTPAGETDEQAIARLAALSPIDYDRAREAEAERLNVRVGTLDRLVGQIRKASEGPEIIFDEVEPHPERVDGAALLSDIAKAVHRFIACKPDTADAVALWLAMTWLIDVVQVAPLAVITAPEKRCGKSQLLFFMGRLAARPLAASNISPAALFRSIDAWHPTLLIDEADAFMRENEELRGLLNCGHTRDSAYIIRTVGENFTPTRFNVWGAKALAGIGHLADTLMDRAVVLELRRKLPHEEVERLRYAGPDFFEGLQSRLARFATDNAGRVRQARPELPSDLNDRAQDNWEPLLAIADVAGGDWPERARAAARLISGAESAAMSVSTELLADIKDILGSRSLAKVSTHDLIDALCADDEMPWSTYNRGKPLSPRQLARRLGEFGIRSKNIRTPKGQHKGFDAEQFEDAFDRYLLTPREMPSRRPTGEKPNSSNGLVGTDYEGVTVAGNGSVPLEAPPRKGRDAGTDSEEEGRKWKV